MNDQCETLTEKPRGRGRPRKGSPAVPKRPQRQPDYQKIQNLLREDILEGRLPADARLKVSDVAERYSVSTNPAREALQALEGEGLVIISANRGARVRRIDEAFIRDISEMRALVEPYLVRGFVEFARTDDIDILIALQTTCQRAADDNDYSAFHRANVSFHDFMIERHHNAEAVHIWKKHSNWLRALHRRHPLSFANMRRSCAEHWELVEAVRSGNPEAAAAVIARHTTNSAAVFIEHVRRDRLQRSEVSVERTERDGDRLSVVG